jgi:hypothetical protein
MDEPMPCGEPLNYVFNLQNKLLILGDSRNRALMVDSEQLGTP